MDSNTTPHTPPLSMTTEGGLGTLMSNPDRCLEDPCNDGTYFEDQVNQDSVTHEDEDVDKVIDEFYGETSVPSSISLSYSSQLTCATFCIPTSRAHNRLPQPECSSARLRNNKTQLHRFQRQVGLHHCSHRRGVPPHSVWRIRRVP